MLARLVAAGRVRPVLASVFPLERAHEAFAVQEAGRSVGKVIIRVGEPDVPAAGRAAAPVAGGVRRPARDILPGPCETSPGGPP